MKAYIIHTVKCPERKEHIINQVKDKNIEFCFIIEGEKEEITDEIVNRYFDGELRNVSGITSCAYKHFIAYSKILKEKVEIALILEDDIFLSKEFSKVLSLVISEIKEYDYKNFIVSLEESTLEYVKRSEIIKNKILYQRKHGRTAGAYLIDRLGAESLLTTVEKEKCKLPLDWFHNYCAGENIINIFWVSKPVAIQGSLCGKICSLIDTKKKTSSQIKSLIFESKRIYKKILYSLR
ncbi:MAG: glycosyltransferase family 25 protein [Chitinispirillaceae bacterium]|nr:glycosyltransferase family 25 protein [Chitinispirillaceae bacterium]